MTTIPPHAVHSKGPALSAVLANGTTWERTVVPVGTAARTGLWAVTSLLTLTTVGHYVLADRIVRAAFEDRRPGFFMFGWAWVRTLVLHAPEPTHTYIPIAAVLLVLAVLTQGFALAGRRLQVVLGVVAGAGLLTLVLPAAIVVIVAANAVVWAVVGIAIVVAVLAAIALLIAMLAS